MSIFRFNIFFLIKILFFNNLLCTYATYSLGDIENTENIISSMICIYFNIHYYFSCIMSLYTYYLFYHPYYFKPGVVLRSYIICYYFEGNWRIRFKAQCILIWIVGGGGSGVFRGGGPMGAVAPGSKFNWKFFFFKQIKTVSYFFLCQQNVKT